MSIRDGAIAGRYLDLPGKLLSAEFSGIDCKISSIDLDSSMAIGSIDCWLSNLTKGLDEAYESWV